MQQSSILVPRQDKQQSWMGLWLMKLEVSQEIFFHATGCSPAGQFDTARARNCFEKSHSPADSQPRAVPPLQGAALWAAALSWWVTPSLYQGLVCPKETQMQIPRTKSSLTVPHHGQVNQRNSYSILQQNQNFVDLKICKEFFAQAPAWGFNQLRTLGFIFFIILSVVNETKQRVFTLFVCKLQVCLKKNPLSSYWEILHFLSILSLFLQIL